MSSVHVLIIRTRATRSEYVEYWLQTEHKIIYISMESSFVFHLFIAVCSENKSLVGGLVSVLYYDHSWSIVSDPVVGKAIEAEALAL